MKRKIDKFFGNEKKSKEIAEEIVQIFTTTANIKNIEYSFDISKENGKIKNRQDNTCFYFDTKPNTVINSFKKALFDEDLAYIKKNSEDEKKLVKNTEEFLKKVANKINYGYNEEMKETIRKVILPGSRQQDIPLNEIKIVSIDVADYSAIPESAKYTLKIGKKQDTDIKIKEVTQFIQEKQEQTGKDIKEIFEEEKNISPLFKNILTIEKGDKYLNDVTINFFIDYSLSQGPNENLIKKPD